MKTTDVLNSCEKYFNGFQDVYEHKDVRSTVEGIIKIISYLTLVFPCAFAITYYKYKDVKQINEIVDSVVWLKVDMAYHQLNENEKVLKARQKDLINYLIIQAQDIDISNPTETEIQRFQKAFYLLEPKSQSEYFEKCISNELFSKVVAFIPRDVPVLHFSSRTGNQLKGFENAKILLEKLNEFNNLKELELSLEDLGYFSPSAYYEFKSKINTEMKNSWTKTIEDIESGKIGWINTVDILEKRNGKRKWVKNAYYSPSGAAHFIENYTIPIIGTIPLTAKFVAVHPDLNFAITFKNVSIQGQNGQLTLAHFGGSLQDPNESDYLNVIEAYFQKEGYK